MAVRLAIQDSNRPCSFNRDPEACAGNELAPDPAHASGSRLSDRRTAKIEILRTRRHVLVAVLAIGIVQTSGAAPELSANPLATCEVELIAPEPAVKGSGRAPYRLGRTGATRFLAADYQRRHGVDWHVPANVDRNVPRIRMLLMCPGGPLIIDLDVTVDGEPFRSRREQAIDIALQPAIEEPKSGARGPIAARLARYVAQQEGQVPRDEVRWLLAQWTPGPVLMQLRHGYASERAAMAPLVAWIDRDGNGKLSRVEMDAVQTGMRRTDINGDDLVDVRELQRGRSGGKPSIQAWRPPRLLIHLSDETDWAALFDEIRGLYRTEDRITHHSFRDAKHLVERVDENKNGAWDAGETERLHGVPSDLLVRIDFGHSDQVKPSLTVLQIDRSLGAADEVLLATERQVTVRLAESSVEFSAAQPAPQAGMGTITDQISVGACTDGYPLLRLLDADNDRRLSSRERRGISNLLADLDRDQDGQVTTQEIDAPIRLSVTLGPNAHRILATPTSAGGRSVRGGRLRPPPWFVSMDANSDGDLSRSEFVGNRKQFQRLDADSDGLISVKEALRFEPNL